MVNPKNKVRNVILIISFLVGFVLILQIKSMKNRTVFYNIETIRELELQLSIENNELVGLNEYITRKTAEFEELKNAKFEENFKELLKKQNLYTKALAGKAGFIGKGIKVEIRDSDKEILPTQNPNDFIVHDQDILRIVNDLKIAGAEVISINNQIYKTDSEIKCSGSTITINGKTFGQPFVIRAIGDPDTLEATIKAKESYAYMINSLFGIRVKATREDSIVIYSSQKYKNYLYIQEVAS